MLLRVHAHFDSYSNRWFKGNENLLKPERFAKMKFLLGSSAAFFTLFQVFALILDGPASELVLEPILGIILARVLELVLGPIWNPILRFRRTMV